MNNIVNGNDLACIPQTSPNDCGEGIHLEAVTNSSVSRNTSENNTGGILLETGSRPAASAHRVRWADRLLWADVGNNVADNIVINNVWDCGITMPSHNSNAAPGGVPTPPPGVSSTTRSRATCPRTTARWGVVDQGS